MILNILAFGTFGLELSVWNFQFGTSGGESKVGLW